MKHVLPLMAAALVTVMLAACGEQAALSPEREQVAQQKESTLHRLETQWAGLSLEAKKDTSLTTKDAAAAAEKAHVEAKKRRERPPG